MSMSDYKLCDVCGEKSFYDANLLYTDGTDEYAKNNAMGHCRRDICGRNVGLGIDRAVMSC